MAAWDFTDMYTLNPWTCGLWVHVYISKIPSSHGINIICNILRFYTEYLNFLAQTQIFKNGI